MRFILLSLATLALASCAAAPLAVDPTSDAPEFGPTWAAIGELPGTYAEALRLWQRPEDVNAWIGARFEYDVDRAARLSENQRVAAQRVQIHSPEASYERKPRQQAPKATREERASPLAPADWLPRSATARG